MRQIFIITIMLILFKHTGAQDLTHPQQPQPHMPVRLDPVKDKLEYKGYTIRLIPTIDGYYGYDIFKGQKIIAHQFENPVPGKGLSNREDVFSLAKWVIEEYTKTGHIPPVIPPGIVIHPKQPSSN